MAKDKSPLRQKDIRTGAQQERKRIIKLLENHKETWNRMSNGERGDFVHIESLISAIKGENSE